MLTVIEDMKYFLCMAYGDLTQNAGSSIEVKVHGICQGNGASITILKAHKVNGYGAKFIYPISNLAGSLTAIVFVDGMEILHIYLNAK